MDAPLADFEHASPILYFAIALAIGLLIGSERERKPGARAGLRTFALIALFGAVAGLLADTFDSAWIIATGLAAVAAMMIAAYAKPVAASEEPGTTTIIATLVCYGLGAMVWLGHPTVAVMLAITTTVLLYFKLELEQWSTSLTRLDWISILRFAVLSLVILPILPDRGYGPYAAINPFNIWLMVVLVSGISLAGYVALRTVGTRHGTLLLGLLGGVVSSTATTLVYGRSSRERPEIGPLAVRIIVLANTAVVLRVALISLAVAPGLAPSVWRSLAAPLLVGATGALWFWRSTDSESRLPTPEVANPVDLKTALTFGAIYGLALIAAAWLTDIGGGRGLYVLALVAGLTDVDAITLSTLRLVDIGTIGAALAVDAIAIALMSNNLFKLVLLIFAADRATARRAGAVLAAMAVSLAIVVLLGGS